ncbi:TetR/AcrR family transcriptional regulator [Streptomyces sp. NPDC096311]|uniref:TetR/AcrR family transcriptional regulator n=1 Tax=Streptomyces sp. NPDC096311 TaxID=3366083 RepID=UPI00380B8B6C
MSQQNPGSLRAPDPSADRPRTRNARGEGDKLREEVLAAAVRLVSDNERMRPAPLSLREVAREAGITAPAIYRHFADKDELVAAVMRQLFSQLIEAMDRADEEAADLAPSSRFAALAHAYCRFAEENPSCFRVMFAVAGMATDASSNSQSPVSELAERWFRAMTRLSEAGLHLMQGPEQAAISAWSSVHGRIALDQSTSPHCLGDVHTFVDDFAASLDLAPRGHD